MALSKDEQRTLEEMERALLDDDPTTATVAYDYGSQHAPAPTSTVRGPAEV